MILDALKQHSFCLIRHGETVANRDGLIAGRLDVPLTDFGRDQARALQRASWQDQITLFCSPKERALETCRLAFPDRESERVAGLSERDWGIFEGQPLTAAHRREGKPPEGEDWQCFLNRAGDAITYCIHASENALPVMVCHSGIIRAARILTGQPNTGSRPPNAKAILFRWAGDRHIEEAYHP